jgi:flagellar biogenesis protein FliO
MDISIILIIVVLAIYLVWKLMGTRNRKKNEPRRFSIRKHRRKELDEDDE